MTALPLVITNAGWEAFTAAQLDDEIDLTISSVGLTADEFVVAPTLTALPGQFREVGTVSGTAVDEATIHLTIRDDAAQSYTVRGFALYLEDGTLFAVYGQQDPIFEKATPAAMLIALDIAFATAVVDELVFGDTNFLYPPATTEVLGVVELATEGEAAEGEDDSRAVTPAALKAALLTFLPIGAITAWYGLAAGVPAGWAICNGQTVARSDGGGNITTPDLRDRAIVGAGPTHAQGSTFGADSKTVNSAAGGAHTPTGNLPPHDHGLAGTGTASVASTGITIAAPLRSNVAGGGSGTAVDSVTLTDPQHGHALAGTTNETGPLALALDPVAAHQHEVTVNVTQPSLALHYIMRI